MNKLPSNHFSWAGKPAKIRKEILEADVGSKKAYLNTLLLSNSTGPKGTFSPIANGPYSQTILTYNMLLDMVLSVWTESEN